MVAMFSIWLASLCIQEMSTLFQFMTTRIGTSTFTRTFERKTCTFLPVIFNTMKDRWIKIMLSGTFKKLARVFKF